MTASIAESNSELVSSNTLSFYEAAKDDLRCVFKALKRDAEWQPSLEGILPYTQAKWVGVEHGDSNEKDHFTPDQEAAARPFLENMGFYNEILPPKGTQYEQILIIGGLMRVNHERLQWVKNLLDTQYISADKIVFLAGQRARDSKEGNISEIIKSSGRYPGYAVENNLWVKHETNKLDIDKWERPLASETELARISINKVFEADVLTHRIDLSTQLEARTEVPTRLVSDYAYKIKGYPEIIVINAAATSRPLGPSRHTTASSAQEWLARHRPSRGAEVLLVSGNPHTLRTANDVEAAIQATHQDVHVDPSGPAASKNASIQLVLGEVGRLLYADAQ